MTPRRWLAIAAGAGIALAVVAAIARPLAVHADARLVIVAIGLAFAWSLFLVDIRWTANRVAVCALIFYAIAAALMLVTPIDGDEPYYLLITESIAHDGDLDLANQYRDLAHSASGRLDLRPQIGDAHGAHGEEYSRLEPLLPLLMVPGYLLAGLPGAIATIVIFGALLARSTVRLFEDEGIDDATIRALLPLIAFGPPLVFYSARIWPEVPAAFCFVEAVRGIRNRRATRWLPALAAFVLLKFRFLLVAVVLLARTLRSWRHIAIAVVIVAILLPIGMATTGHTWHEIVPGPALWMFYGIFGLLLDGAAGILFQAPVYAFGVLAIARWRSMPAAFRLGLSSSLLYLIYLAPRPEWHGGWSPPLRYIVFLMPILALGVAAMWKKIAAPPLYAAMAWTFAVTAHGLAYPWRLFHIANGENAAGEMLSSVWHSDFSRLFPSYIRPNTACFVGAIVAAVAFVIFRSGKWITPAVIAALIAIAFFFARRPGDRIDFEDAHVIHRGGTLFPYEFQVQRFLYRGGWILRSGDSLVFLAREGPSLLQYSASAPAMIQLGAGAYPLPPTPHGYGSIHVDIARSGRIELKCLEGAVNLDRMDHE